MHIGKLTALAVSHAIRAGKTGLINDGGGLYLKNGSSWICRYPGPNGRNREMGLGSALDVGLAEARARTAEARRLRREGQDPIEARRASRAAQAIAIVTFAAAAKAYIDAHEPGWRSAKHRHQWRSSLANLVYPVIGDIPVGAVGVADVLRVLKPLWVAKPETANRVRNRIELVLDAARAQGQRDGDNPARWRGHLDHLLPRRSKLQTVKHYAALDYHEIAAFMVELQRQPGPAPRALAFAILTATRTDETLGATWDEIDLEAGVWAIPAERMKSERPHRVPLSDPALAVLADMAAIRMNGYVFPGQRGRLSPGMMALTLKRMGRSETVHGFRSAFRDWCGNETNTPREIAEAALAHATGDATELAYRRSDALAKRRALMTRWAGFCFPTSADVIPLRHR